MENNLQIIASGDEWIKMGVQSTFSTLYKLIDDAEDSLLLTAYIFTKLEKALKRGIKVEIFYTR